MRVGWTGIGAVPGVVLLLLIGAMGGCGSTVRDGDDLVPNTTLWFDEEVSPTGAEPLPEPGSSDGRQTEKGVTPDWVTPVTDDSFLTLVERHRPNELGRILILEYHDFQDEEGRWARSWDNFRLDLETLYERGYRAVSLLDYLSAQMPLPAGTSPVIFTFDDSLLSQLRLVKHDGLWEAHPQSAVGMMLQFAKERPDFGVAGTFYVNFTPVPFRERELWQEKIRFLVEHGFEVANHALYHEDLSGLTDEQVQETLATQVVSLREVLPDYSGSTLALPFGLWPQNQTLAVRGEHQGISYQHQAVLLVGADPVHSPFDSRLDVMALPRVQAIASEFERWFPFLEYARYISDGDPLSLTIPEEMAQYLNLSVVGSRTLRTYVAD